VEHAETINSTEYWDQRFAADWKANNGAEQSQFFSRIAVDHLPAWFIRYLKLHQPSFCDWGCAMGNGTRILHELLSLKNITGIDFSTVAIEQARTNYPSIPFIAADLVTDDHFPSFDVIFTSNTLEHFDEPWDTLDRLSCFAKKFIVVLIPFQEYNRHFEHFYTFEPANIPLTVGASHTLIHFSIFNAAEYPLTYWNGHQILLVYSTYSELAGLGLTLSDLTCIEKAPAPAPDPAPAPEVPNPVVPMAEALLTRTGEIQVHTAEIQAHTAELQARTSEMQEEQKRLEQSILQLKEKHDLERDNLNRRLESLYSLQNEIMAGNRESVEKLDLLQAAENATIDLLNQMLVEKKEK